MTHLSRPSVPPRTQVWAAAAAAASLPAGGRLKFYTEEIVEDPLGHADKVRQVEAF
jgi:hypothetical protein